MEMKNFLLQLPHLQVAIGGPSGPWVQFGKGQGATQHLSDIILVAGSALCCGFLEVVQRVTVERGGSTNDRAPDDPT